MPVGGIAGADGCALTAATQAVLAGQSVLDERVLFPGDVEHHVLRSRIVGCAVELQVDAYPPLGECHISHLELNGSAHHWHEGSRSLPPEDRVCAAVEVVE